MGLGLLLTAACLKPDPMFKPGGSGGQGPDSEATETNNPDSHGPTSTAEAEARGGQEGASSSAATEHGEFGESDRSTATSGETGSESHSDGGGTTETGRDDEGDSANSTLSSGEIGGTSDAGDTTETNELGSGSLEEDTTTPGDDSESSSEATTDTTSTETAESGSDTTTEDTAEDTSEDTSGSGCAPIICLEANAGQPIDDLVFLISSTFGFRIILPEPYTRIIGATFFTGEGSGDNRIELWTDRNVQPDRRLDQIVWPMESNLGWQGGFFSAPQMVDPGSIHWLIWTGVPGAQGSIATDGNFIPYFETNDNGQTFFESSGRVRWRNRVYCCRD